MSNVPAHGSSFPFSPGLRGPLSFFLFLFAAPLNLLGQEPPDTIPITVTVQVLDRTTSEPLQNVVVHLRDLQIHTFSDSVGQFRLTGVQPGTYRMRLTRQGYLPEEGDFRILMSGSFQIALIPSGPGGDLGVGQVFGRVLERESGDPVMGALVSLAGTQHRRETNSRGYFEFPEVPAGPQVLIVEQLGRESREDRLVVLEDQGLEVEVLLSIEPIQLEGFTVTAHSKWLVTSGFFRRQRSGGYDGRQWDGVALDTLGPVILRDALETVSGINQAGSRGYVSRGRCVMTIFVEGFQMPSGYDLDMIKPENVEAMEVFNGRGSTMPIEYATYCGVILIWLKH